jgi:hypothetical protein
MNDYHVYTPSSTDITIRWRRLYDYIPASEQPKYQQKWADHRAKCAAGIEALAEKEPIPFMGWG